MSIIDRALKKAQKSLEDQQAEPLQKNDQLKNTQSVLSQYQEQQSPRHRMSWPWWVLFGLLALMIALQFFHGITLWQVHKAPVKPKPKHAAVVAPAPVSPITKLHLQGIMASDNRRVALINQQTLYAGDRLKGFLIQSIGENSVEVTDGHNSYALRVTEP